MGGCLQELAGVMVYLSEEVDRQLDYHVLYFVSY